MGIKDVLPSRRFTFVVGALVLSAGLIVGARIVTTPAKAPTATEVTSVANSPASQDWQKTLKDIQDRSPLNKAPQGPTTDKVQELLNAATSDNLTDTVARTLFVNLSAAKAQGLGNDIPTQDTLIADAVEKINNTKPANRYNEASLLVVENNKDTMRAYGNAFMQTIARHPEANFGRAIYTIATSTDNADPARLAPLKGIGEGYGALADDLAELEVPKSLAPFHLKIINNFALIATSFPDIEKLYTDPLRALAAYQRYDALNNETYRLFINIAQNLSQNGILFTKDDPGSAWSSLAS